MFYRGLYSYRQRLCVITLFRNIFSNCFCMLSEFAFERKVWRVQVAHLHNAARALSSLSRCFQLSTNLDRDFFRYLWYCGKRTNRMSLSVALVKFHWFGTCFFINQNAKILVCILLFSEIALQTKSGKYFQIWLFPPIWGEKMAAFRACACKLSWTLLFARPRSAPIWGGKKVEFRDWTRHCRVLSLALQDIYDVEIEDMATIDLHLILCTPGLMYNPEFFSILSSKKQFE